MNRCLPSLSVALLAAFTACSQPEVAGVEPRSLKITPYATEVDVGGTPVAFTATLEGVSGEVVWALTPDLGALSSATGLETTYTPPSFAAQTTVLVTASVGELSAFALISLTPVEVEVENDGQSIYVNPNTGADTQDGSADAPLKTIRRALTIAEEGATVYLAGGIYSESSGESYLEVTDGGAGYLVPAGVEITTDPNDDAAPVVIRNDAAARDAFRFAGDGRLSGVRLEGFNRGLSADTGTQIVSDVTMLGIGEFGVVLEGAADFSCTGCHVSVSQGVAFNLDGDARLWVDGASSINARSPANEASLVAIFLVADSQAEATLDLAGGATGGTYAVVSGKLTLRNVDVRLRNHKQDVIFVGAEGHLAMFDGRVSGGYLHNGSSFMEALTSSGTLSINGTVFEDNPGGALSLGGGSADIRNALIQNVGDRDTVFHGMGLNAIEVKGAVALKMRGTQVRNVKSAGNYDPPTPGTDGTGLLVTDTTGGIDLGTEAQPGRNHFQDCGFTCLRLAQNAGDRTVLAAGNTWNANEQGADAEGRYGARLVDESEFGRNFYKSNEGSVQF